MGERFLRRKPIDRIEETDTGEGGRPERSLGLWQLTAIGVGGIIGAGIFTLAGTMANGTAGPAVLISFLAAGVARAAAAPSYAEFAGLIPQAGSAHTYGYAALGELAGWFIGWDPLPEYTAIVSVVAIGTSGYFGFLVGEMKADLPAAQVVADQVGVPLCPPEQVPQPVRGGVPDVLGCGPAVLARQGREQSRGQVLHPALGFTLERLLPPGTVYAVACGHRMIFSLHTPMINGGRARFHSALTADRARRPYATRGSLVGRV